jgi:hypothetical protein
MQIEVYIEDRLHRVEVEPGTLESGRELFDRMDRDMDAGWKMGPDFVERPDRGQRARIAAERLMLALDQGNPGLTQAMAGYILSRLPEVRQIHVDTTGQPQHTELLGVDGNPVT